MVIPAVAGPVFRVRLGHHRWRRGAVATGSTAAHGRRSGEPGEPNGGVSGGLLRQVEPGDFHSHEGTEP